MERKGGDAGLENNISRYEPTSSETASLKTAISHTLSSSSRKERVCSLSRATLSHCEPPRKCTGLEFEVSFERKVWRCFPRAVSYCCDIPDVKESSST